MNINLKLGQIVIESSLMSAKSNLLPSRQLHKRYVNTNIIQQSLNTLDVFRGLLEGMPHQKNRVIRDVSKGIELLSIKQNQIIYEEGEKAKQIFLVLNGSVSSCITNIIVEEEGQSRNQYQEIDTFEKGSGFGEGEFVAATVRNVTTLAKQDQTVIGKLQISSFQQILQNYRKRVYYRKRDMFSQCPLFANLNQIKLQFIINNTKPMTYNISQKIMKQGQKPKTLLLINKGQISLYRKKKESQLKKYSSVSIKEIQGQQKLMLGVLNEGNFIGDLQFVLNKKYSYNGICSTEKAELYYCDHRIILSQMTQQQLQRASQYYRLRQQFNSNKIIKYNKASELIEKRKRQLLPPMTPEQLKLKRRLMHRHVQNKPTLIGHSTPLDIMKMIKRKQIRVMKQPEQDRNNPQIELLDNHTLKKKSYNSPDRLGSLLSIKTPNRKRFITEPNINSSFDANPQNDLETLKKGKSMMLGLKSNKQKLNVLKTPKSRKMELIGKVLKFKEEKSEVSEFQSLIEKFKSEKSQND